MAGGASGSSSQTVSAEALERILQSSREASQASMAALIESLPSLLARPVSTSTARTSQIKPPKWSDEDTPSEFFNKYEKALKHNGVDKSEWGHVLPIYLSGRAQASFSQVSKEMLPDYELVKATMLESLGDTPASADRRWWTISHLPGETPGAFYLRVRAIGLRRLHGL